ARQRRPDQRGSGHESNVLPLPSRERAGVRVSRGAAAPLTVALSPAGGEGTGARRSSHFSDQSTCSCPRVPRHPMITDGQGRDRARRRELAALARPHVFRDYRGTMTRPEADRIEAVSPQVASALRQMSGMERLRLGHETWELTCYRLAVYFASRHPEWSAEEIQRQVARRLLGDAGRTPPISR